MHHEDQSLQKQKTHAEDVAYAAFHDTVFDVGEELEKYDECAALSGTKLQTALDEFYVLKSSINAAYEVLLSAALSPLSSRLQRCKANIETRIAEMMILLTSNAAHTTTEQTVLCDTSISEPKDQAKGESRERVSTDCDGDVTVQTDGPSVQSNNGTVSDSKQSCDMKSNPNDDSTVEQDKDLHMEQVTVPGCRTCGAMYKEMNMTMICVLRIALMLTHMTLHVNVAPAVD